MWIVRLALARPYSFIVFSLVLLLISPVVLLRTPVDIFPSINIPVISVIWTYTGLAPTEMETRIVSIFERIVSAIYNALPKIKATLPPQLVITPQFDQSLFVRASLQGVVREAGIAAALTSLMILMFLGSWRSTLIIAISIPLSILTSLLVLSALGQTINIMTLGGLALAVGILVDDATVTIENIERQFSSGKELVQAILDGAEQIAVPALVSTLSISIVFVPMFFLTGVARYLFVPLAEAVVFALLASYFLSRTLVPTLVMYLMKKEAARYQHPEAESRPGLFGRLHHRFE